MKTISYYFLSFLLCSISLSAHARKLRKTPMNRYFCWESFIENEAPGPGGGSGGQTLAVFRQHYYFPEHTTPPIIPSRDARYIACHDQGRFGERDRADYPRLGLEQNVFSLWSARDILLQDGDSNGELDINDAIAKDLRERGVEVGEVNLFTSLKWSLSPASWRQSIMGYILRPIVDHEKGSAFCPTIEDFNSNSDNTLLSVLKEYISSTTPLYMGVSEPLEVQTENGEFRTVKQDRLLVSFPTVQNAWFYLDRGRHLPPGKEELESKAIHFYWPINDENPYQKGPGQTRYTIKHPSSLDLSKKHLDIVAPDQRIGCIPFIKR